MASLDDARRLVQHMLGTAFSGVTSTTHGDFTLRQGSSRAFIQVWQEPGDRHKFVSITVPLLFAVPTSAEVFEYVATHADDCVFGHLSLERKDGVADLFFTHTLLADHLDQPELEITIASMLSNADAMDDELQSKFGGQRFHEGD